MKGTLHNSDRVDVFTFQIDSMENISISLLNEQNIGMTWVLHHESDLNNYVAYGENEGNVVKGTYNAKPVNIIYTSISMRIKMVHMY